MIINDKEYGQFNVNLCDDGSMDTVISVSHGLIKTREYRYDCEYGSQFRDRNSGQMMDEGFAELAEESIDAFVEEHLQ